ncbi:hypothetical protein KFE25_012346 [Diacronema lutheri]|uniref:Fungal lipase-type domain-containing protein n=1 Tax=Diacronema lutheri TaxID=2081491 RepID=A0A8J5XIC8_DIALT|nr:hypothetical protein KFE25_012346 [Diacronema lutheri]
MRERAAVPRATLRERAHGVWRAAERFGVELRNTAAVPIGRVLLSPAELWGSGSVNAAFIDLFHSPSSGWRDADEQALRAHVQAQLARALRRPRCVVFYRTDSADPGHTKRVPWTGAGLLFVPPRWLHVRARRALERQRDYPQLLQAALLLSLAPYNLNASRTADVELGGACHRSSWLVDRALRHPLDTLRVGAGALARPFRRAAQPAHTLHAVRTLSSQRVCCTASWRTRARASWLPGASALRWALRRTAAREGGGGGGSVNGGGSDGTGGKGASSDGFVTLAFRGTKQLSDILTDVDALPTRFGAAGGRAHRGFAKAFDSVEPQIHALLAEALPNGGRVLLTGHSLGGALAQLAAVAIANASTAERPLRALLVTFAAPAVGDGTFARELRAAAEPCGGLRVYNTDDPIPHIATTLGYKHAGVPIVLRLGDEAKAAYRRVAAPQPGFNAWASHVLYHVGATVYAVWTPRPPGRPPEPDDDDPWPLWGWGAPPTKARVKRQKN